MKIIHSRKSLRESAERRYGDAETRLREGYRAKSVTYTLIVGTVCLLTFTLIILLHNLF